MASASGRDSLHFTLFGSGIIWIAVHGIQRAAGICWKHIDWKRLRFSEHRQEQCRKGVFATDIRQRLSRSGITYHVYHGRHNVRDRTAIIWHEIISLRHSGHVCTKSISPGPLRWLRTETAMNTELLSEVEEVITKKQSVRYTHVSVVS